MRMVGRSRGIVHRHYKPQSKRWMRPKHKAKLNLDGFWFFVEAMLTTFAMVLTFIFVWWNFC